MSLTPLSFRNYKSEWGFIADNSLDYFFETQLFGCHETEFEKWLKRQRLFVKRYSEQLKKSLNDIVLPENKWGFFTSRFERAKRTEYLISKYPDGYFETQKGEGKELQVACFLPDTYGQKPYRISFYRKCGPVYHESYDSRLEALEHLARSGYEHAEGILDSLVGTVEWDRDIYVTKWKQENLFPWEGIKRDQHIPEVQHLFADALIEIKKKNL